MISRIRTNILYHCFEDRTIIERNLKLIYYITQSARVIYF